MAAPDYCVIRTILSTPIERRCICVVPDPELQRLCSGYHGTSVCIHYNNPTTECTHPEAWGSTTSAHNGSA